MSYLILLSHADLQLFHSDVVTKLSDPSYRGKVVVSYTAQSRR